MNRFVTTDKAKLDDAFSKMAAESIVYGVKQIGAGYAYGRLHPDDELRLDYDISLLPPNKYWLPYGDCAGRL